MDDGHNKKSLQALVDGPTGANWHSLEQIQTPAAPVILFKQRPRPAKKYLSCTESLSPSIENVYAD
jgi:hypothetical protein